MTLVQIPVILLYFFIVNDFTSRFIRQQWEYQKRDLSVYTGNVSDEIQKIDSFLFYDCYGAFTGQTDGEYAELKKQSDAFVNENSIINGLFLYDAQGVRFHSSFSSDVSAPEALGKLADDLLGKEKQMKNGWQLLEYEGRHALMQTASANGMTAAAVILTDRLAAASSIKYHLPGSVLLMRKDSILTSTLWQRNSGIQIPSGLEEPFILESGKHRYMLCDAGLLGMRAVYGVIYQYSFRWLYLFGYMMIALAAVSMFVTMFYLHRSILRPLGNMTGIMRQIADGDKDLRLPEAKTAELGEISGSFNTMMDRLNEAKIESYEYQLTARRAKMDALRLQIRRHFFLNCLKNIYAMATTGDFEGVKQTAFLLSGNLRYTLNFDEDSVPLKKELEMCEDYIRLQGVGQPRKPLLVTDSDPELDDFAVPPVSLLTILENSCKYGMMQEGILVIRIKTEIRKLDDSSFAVLSVQDNGPGFDAEMLKMLNRDLNRVQENNHIGMANTLLRFKMLYGEECSVLFSNNKGARVDLMIPMKPAGEEI